jgi:hypothetical protein
VTSISYGAVTGGGVTTSSTFFNGNSLTETLFNTTNNAIDVVYTFNVTTPSTSPVCPLTPPTQVVTVRVLPAPVFTLNSTVNQLCSGSQTNITLNTTVNGAQIRLQSVNYGTASGSLVAGVLFSNGQQVTEVLTNNTNASTTVTYVFEAIVGSCTPSATQTVNVIVNPNPAFTVTNNTAVICSGTATNLLFASPTTGHQINVTGISYGSVTGGTVTLASTFFNANSLVETLHNNTNVPIDVVYTFNVTTPGTTPVCPLAPSTQVITVRVLPAPTFSNTSTVSEMCSGSQTNILLNTTVTGAQIRLQAVNYGAVAGTLAPGVLYTDGQQITEVLVNSTNSPVTVVYTFEAIVGSCVPSATQTVNVVVNPNPNFSVTNNAATICSGTQTNIVFASTTSGHSINLTSVNYGTTSGGVLIAGTSTFTDGFVLTETLNNNTNAATDVTYVFNVTTPSTTPSCPLVPTTQTIVVRVEPSPTFTLTNNTPQFCSGNQTSILLNTPVAGAQIRLQAVSYGAVTGTLSAGALYTNGQQILEVLANPTNAPVTVVYTFEAVVSSCVPSAQQVASVIVDPIPTLATNLSSQELCEGQLSTIVLSNPNNVAGTQYIWTVVATGVSGAANQPTPVPPGNINTPLTLTTPGPTGTVNYNIRASANGCLSLQESVQLTLRRQPVVGVPSNTVLCEPALITLNGTVSGGASTGLWSVITGLGSLSATNVITGTPTSTNSLYAVDPADIGTAVTMRLTTNDPDGPSGLCQVAFADYSITINRSARVDAGPDLEQCADAPSIQLQGSTTYSPNGVLWTKVSAAGVFSDDTDPTSLYSYSNPTEINQIMTLRLTAADPDAAGPCTSVSDDMTLKVNPLPLVSYTGLGAQMAENAAPVTLTGNQVNGLFTISPATSFIGPTIQDPTDESVFDPDDAELGVNIITYTYTDANGCTDFDAQQVLINPVTNVDYIIEGARLTATQEWEVCSDQGLVRLVGNPPVSSGSPPETRFHADPSSPLGQLYGNPISIVFQNGDYFIDTDNLVSDTYLVRYTFKNQFNAITFKSYPVKILASPAADINVANSCIRDAIQFNDGSTLPPTPFPTSIVAWRWDFDDQSFSNVQNPSHGYIQPKTYDIELVAGTDQGCTGTALQQIRVGDVPITKFTWTAICNNDSTRFVDQSTSEFSLINQYKWDFGDGFIITGAPDVDVNGSQTSGTFKNPNHKYTLNDNYDVTLEITTNDGCVNTYVQPVFILPYDTVRVSSLGYREAFETDDGGWEPESLWREISTTSSLPDSIRIRDSIRYSWEWNIPSGATINNSLNGTKVWWTGRRIPADPYGTNNPRYFNATSYFTSETSAVNGPCFDLTQLERPMVGLDYWSDSEASRDGAVLQYSTDGGITWEIVGPFAGNPNRDEGIQWFNSSGIIGKPGNQLIGDYGWSDKGGGWKNGRFHLDMIDPAKRLQVRLRIAFGSDGANNVQQTYDGFAFDNFYVGDKVRNVLVEHFTNSHPATVIADGVINGLYQDQLDMRAAYGGMSDFHHIQYHMNQPSADPLNRDNAIDPAARALYMGASSPPFTIMDGRLDGKFNGNYINITQVEIDRQALTDPVFLLRLDSALVNPGTVPNANNKINPVFTITAQKDFTEPLLVNVALIENAVGTSQNVLRKLLFGPDGLTLTNAWTAGSSSTINRGPIEINVPVVTPSGLTMIAWVQNKNTKEIYQSAVLAAPTKVGGVNVGVEDGPKEPTVLEQVRIYPNPANSKFSFYVPGEDAAGFEWRISDQRGVVVAKGTFDDVFDQKLDVDVAGLSNAVYIVTISGPGQEVVHHKLVVMNHH